MDASKKTVNGFTGKLGKRFFEKAVSLFYFLFLVKLYAHKSLYFIVDDFIFQ